MFLKLDLNKAYDKLEWPFTNETFSRLGVPSDLVDVIMLCVSSASFCVLWNGEAADSFNSTRGLQQGDPFSPYLFVLSLERLSHLIEEKVNEGAWKPITLNYGGPRLSHLCLPMILFCSLKPTYPRLEWLMKFLASFVLNLVRILVLANQTY